MSVSTILAMKNYLNELLNWANNLIPVGSFWLVYAYISAETSPLVWREMIEELCFKADKEQRTLS